MVEKVQDLYLPNAVLTRIIKEAMPERFLIGKDAHPAISKAASSFIVYATTLANEHCEKAKRKTISPVDIMNALKEMNFNHFEEQINEFMAKYRSQKKAKPSGGAIGSNAGPGPGDPEESNFDEKEPDELDIDEIAELEDEETGNDEDFSILEDENKDVPVTEN